MQVVPTVRHIFLLPSDISRIPVITSLLPKRRTKARLGGPAIYPDAWKNGQCQQFSEIKQVKKAWGFTHIYDNVPHYLRAEARRRVRNYFSSGCGPYYRYHHGENKLSPREQADILAILAKYGPTDGLTFDHYETDWNFD